jgi:glyoxylase-like metal-dependent hydrolase (beta-lactamase superfamily II)/rhodanese-related sulfurtransferase
MDVRELNAGNCKTYLIRSKGTAVLVDPVRERFAAYQREIASEGVSLVAVVETHTHADHLMLNRQLKEELGAPLLMHQASPIPTVDRHLHDGDRIDVGDEAIEVMHTPGHTPDSICLLLPGAVLTGDTLLIGGSGRTDFPGGDAGAQYDAVTRRLFALPGATVVWPAHDYKGNTQSTIGREKRENPRFLGKSCAEYVATMAGLGLPYPDRIQESLQVNQSGFEAGELSFPAMSELASVPSVTAHEVASRLHGPNRPLVLDVREPEEFTGDLGHIEGALLVPLDALERRLPKLGGYVDREVVVVCRAGARSATAAAILKRAGFSRVANLDGGMLAWARASRPVQR